MPTTYSVPEISCDHCKSTIEAALTPLDGVHHVHVDIDAKTVAVDGGTSDQIVSALEDAGYDVAP